MGQHRARRETNGGADDPGERPVDGGPTRWTTAPMADFALLDPPDGRQLEYCVSGPEGGPALLFR
jgi:hypothetical protein